MMFSEGMEGICHGVGPAGTPNRFSPALDNYSNNIGSDFDEKVPSF